MKVVRNSSFDELVYLWLKSESWKIQGSDKHLLLEPNLDDEQLNKARYKLLNESRKDLLDTTPKDASFEIVEVERSDIPDIYIIPVSDWYLDTGRTFKLADTAENLKPGRGYIINNTRHPTGHHDNVGTKKQYLSKGSATYADEYIVLIAPDSKGPYTLIDGNHRAISLLLAAKEEPNFPWQAILVTDPRIIDSKWYAGSEQAAKHMQIFKQWEAAGRLY